MNDQERKVVFGALNGAPRAFVEASLLNPNFAKLGIAEFRGSFLSNAGGTVLTPTQPSNWSGSSDFIFYVKKIRAQVLQSATGTPPNFQVAAAMQFNIRDVGRNFDWFDDNGILFSTFISPMYYRQEDIEFPLGWPVERGTDLKCSLSQNTSIATGLGNAQTYHAIVSLIGCFVRPE